MNNKNYKINFTAKTITISKNFCKLAQNPANEEYNLLVKIREDFKDFRIITETTRTRKKNKQITYDKMVKYISCQPDSTILLKRFAEVRELSKGTSSPYAFVKNWFNATFPAYEELPQFDEKGNLIPQYDLTAADRILREVTANAA
ncbi:hypothetical protein D1155_13730 [Anaerotruncus sp. 80]|uniref:Uncharacterized protein n=1 Tax=Anaerotruncus colihominis TaxID=169435 RepID=A0A845QRS5_9FIRM|nr:MULTISPECIES: hypothetical protein [Anaerotruncus]NBH62708.1 hypothetical protein [Anaerotruncus colihominis]NCF03363.1 hypothetical protein [Anaerotruncus sp. 80]